MIFRPMLMAIYILRVDIFFLLFVFEYNKYILIIKTSENVALGSDTADMSHCVWHCALLVSIRVLWYWRSALLDDQHL